MGGFTCGASGSMVADLPEDAWGNLGTPFLAVDSVQSQEHGWDSECCNSDSMDSLNPPLDHHMQNY